MGFNGAENSDGRCVREPPGWIFNLMSRGRGAPWKLLRPGLAARTVEGRGFALVSARVRGAAAMAPLELQGATVDAYRCVRTALAACRVDRPVRLWNFIPDILAPLGDLPHRYMIFNAGRFAACQEWYGARQQLPQGLVTASGVGHGGGDLFVHCLAAGRPGQPLENPRQIPAYCYSQRYGPLPPCFARATRLSRAGESDLLLVGGTASVYGERSMHPDDVAAQAEETLRNLAALVDAGSGADAVDGNGRNARPLRRFRTLRVYFVERHQLPPIRQLIETRFPAAMEIEYVHAQLCRPELLVEIEGVAELREEPPLSAAQRARLRTEWWIDGGGGSALPETARRAVAHPARGGPS